MTKPLLQAVRLALFGALVLWSLFALANPEGAVALLERTISPDGHIDNRSSSVWMGAAVLLALALFGPAMLERWRSEPTGLAQARWWTEGSELMLVLALVAIDATGIVLRAISQDHLNDGIYGEDALLENLSVLFAIGAAVLLLIGRSGADRPSRKLATLAAIVAIFFAGEEISWGQRIFAIESTGIFAEANYQRETNLHNFFNPVIQQAFAMLDFAVAMWLLNARAATRWLVARLGCADIQPLVNPRNSLILAPTMFGLGLHCAIYGSELSEEVLAVMLFYGSLRFMLASRGRRSPPGGGTRGEAGALFESEGRVEHALLVERLADDLEP